MKKRILSLATAAALICGTLIAPISASAATTTLLNEDFSSTPLTSGITYTATNGVENWRGNAVTMENSWTIENNRLKLFLKGSGSYDANHAFYQEKQKTSPNLDGLAKLAPVELKIPIAAVNDGAVIEISLDVQQDTTQGDALEGGVIWDDFASIYDKDGNAVVVCKRDKSGTDGYITNSAYGSTTTGRVDFLGWIGKTEAEKGKAINLSKGTGTECSVGGGVWDLGTSTTITFKIDTDGKKVDISYPRTSNANGGGTTWTGDGDLTKGGYILFKGYLNTWITNGNNFAVDQDTNIYFDNIKITAEQDLISKKLPVNNTMDTADSYGIKMQSDNVNTDRFAVVSEPDNATNKVLAIKTELYTGNYASDNTNRLAAVWFPYSGLGANDNLKISYRFKDPTGKHDLYWQHFGSVVTDTDSAWNTLTGEVKDVLRCARYDFDTGFVQGGDDSYFLTYIGLKENTLEGKLLASGPAQQNVQKNMQNITDWVRVDITIERATKKATITYTNEATNAVLATGDVYLINDLAESGALYFKGGPSKNHQTEVETIYLDDVKISTWTALSVTDTNLTDTYDAKTPITLTFSDAVADVATVKQAISIKETDGSEVAPERISVALDTTKKVATVTVDGGLKYGKVGYTLTLTGGVIQSTDGIGMTANYTKTFTTRLGDSVYVASATDLSSNCSTITITNPTDSAKQVWALLALYSSENELIGLGAYTNASLAAGTTTDPINLTATIRTGKEGKTVSRAQILLWNNSTDLVPYHIPVTVK